MPETLYRNRQPRWRAAHRRALNASGITTARAMHIINVKPSAIFDIPDSILRSEIPGLPKITGCVWLLPRDAKKLMTLDSRYGGWSKTLRVEFRRCDVCNRPLLGAEAADRRQVINNSPTARQIPCGDQCAEDLASGLWRAA